MMGIKTTKKKKKELRGSKSLLITRKDYMFCMSSFVYLINYVNVIYTSKTLEQISLKKATPQESAVLTYDFLK